MIAVVQSVIAAHCEKNDSAGNGAGGRRRRALDERLELGLSRCRLNQGAGMMVKK